MTQLDWYASIPSARTVWRALRARVFDRADYAHPEIVTATVGLLPAHHRQLNALGQIAALIGCKAARPEWRVAADVLVRATRDIQGLIARIDHRVHDALGDQALDSSHACPQPHGLGAMLSRHTRYWASEVTADRDFRPSSDAANTLIEQAAAYNRLAARIVTGPANIPWATRCGGSVL
ncbi:hypothetical protein IU450_28400 [Nocardia abscessus]|uniref:hypothetical protein n=1 Tax=Nocardia abscessus TaxID=120957 RepID=UPI0018951C5B|nr:hypothetical protein [Nocardia abscessus]MBF6339781.1 hypothetical protein [Nocardia abscessus]